MKNIFLLFISLIITIQIQAQDQMVVRLDNAGQNELKTFKQKKLEITAYKEGAYLDALISQEKYQELIDEDFQLRITQTAKKNKAHLSQQKGIDGYRTYDEVLAELQQLAIDYPEICTLTDIGDSHGKEYFNSGMTNYEDYQHDIWMLKISDNVNENEDEPAVYYMGAHHAREPISTEVVMGIVNHLLDNYGTDSDITNMVNASEIYIVPIVNPDGHEVVLDQINTWWRKNAADNNNDEIFTSMSEGPDGVDLNRNYGWEFGGSGASGTPSSDLFHGPGAFSEPEAYTMKELLASHHFTTGISFHSYSELVLFPYAYSATTQAPDHYAMEELAINMAETIPNIVGSGHYIPEQSNELYPAAGITDDWAYGKHGIFCFTVELGQEFIPPASQVPQIVEDNIESALLVLNRANHQTLRGHVYDAETNEAVVAEVFIEGLDDQGDYREPYMSNTEFGAYYRLLLEGEFNVTFSAYGYIPQTFSALEITANEITIQDVYLERAESGPIYGSVIDGVTGENIEGAEISILNSPIPATYTDANGVYNINDVSFSNNRIRVSREGYAPFFIEQDINEDHYIINFVLLPAQAISFESGEIGEEFSMSSNPWTIDGNNSWDNNYSVVSGAIGNNQSSIMTLEIEDRASGIVSFYTKVSSESGYDFLHFLVDGATLGSWSGETGWTQVVFQLDEGNHELEWKYTKDGGAIGGLDKAWVDYIEIPPVLTTMVNAGPDQIICTNETAKLNAFAANYSTLSWTSDGDGSFSNTNSSETIYTPGTNDIANGEVNLSIAAEGSTTATDAMVLTVDICTGIESINKLPEFTLSPNPAKTWVNISLLENKADYLEVYNMSGELIQSIQLIENQKDLKLNISRYLSGVYVVKVSNSNGEYQAQRLLIQ
ncbi:MULTISPECIES: M14 family zinc carboxypeptidase [unclassified Lentimicrobium]|uniref:M14 family zinc carboxypeptidase n=1 Tax=unclassified Lentimicrobium TaxID=2677434 RepID=UPI001557FFB2|nr:MULTISPECIES: M14 family zinc carboxypeptidase [unclassified Lentimicrobium]NPD44154.1 T9SS type A sorting domain-containing protein [Lentimicrobium sp. S6]NPD83252.1 T9SS type A sorting domain-containing protein [Lentimicrobium sp. L6]